jgi:two-component system sensor histidine kinase ChiS
MTKGSYILYIEDERPTIKLVREVLKISGFTVVGITSGHEGLDLMRSHKPALLLLDLMMPEPSGFDVYHEMKRDEKLADIPVIVISATVPRKTHISVEDLPPVEDYITKPFDLRRLTRSVKQILNNQVAVT